MSGFTKLGLKLASFAVLAASAALAAHAQESGNAVIGPPQLKDFQLRPRNPIVPGPPVATPPERRPAAPPATTSAPPTAATGTGLQPRPIDRAPAAASRQAPGRAVPTAATPVAGAADWLSSDPVASFPAPVADADTAPPAAPPASETAPDSAFPWLYLLPALLLLLGGWYAVGRRRVALAPAGDAILVDRVALETAPAPPVAPRPDPVPRPWLELSLNAERASFTDTEAEVLFELEIANKGGSAARNLRIDVKLFNAGAEQDREIGAFFKTAGRETTKCQLPGVEAGMVGVIKGRVTMTREEMRAVRLDERLLFIPVIAVNGLYDWGEGRTGQTSKSYLIGREREGAGENEKMGAFRVDQGPRIWRTIGQRPHTLAKRV